MYIYTLYIYNIIYIYIYIYIYMYVFKQMLTFSVFLKSISRIKRHNIFHIDKASVYVYVYVYIYIYIYIYIYEKRLYK